MSCRMPISGATATNILVELPISLTEAVLGGRITVPTVDRPGDDDDPQGLGQRRAAAAARKGIHRRGGAGGDQILTLKVVIGDSGDAELAAFLKPGRKSTRPTRGGGMTP